MIFMIRQTIFAVSLQESRPLLTGINFNIVGDVLECNSTDSYRLARKVVKLDGISEEDRAQIMQTAVIKQGA